MEAPHPGTRQFGGSSPAASVAGAVGERTRAAIQLVEAHTAPNYHPLPVVIERAEGVWVTDVEGRHLIDCLAAYSAVNFGHRHPRLVAAAKAQLDRVTLTSRAFHAEPLGPFCAALAELLGHPMVLPMNTGAEAVESAIKVARRWGHEVKGVEVDQTEVVVASGNFHGRTTTIIGFSADPDARRGFGPFTPGFVQVPFGDAEALAAVLNDRTVAVLLEPIQGEAGVVIPPDDYLSRVRQLTRERGVLLIVDEIQSGLGRTGATLRCDTAGVVPDLVLLGKALGGGIVPVSAVVGRADVLRVLTPGSHGSTFGGNPLAAAVGHEVVRMLVTGEFQAMARERGAQLAAGLQALVGRGLSAVRVAGLWAGVDVDPAVGSAREVCLRLLDLGVLAKDTHGHTVRLAPPLVITEDEVAVVLDAFAHALR